MAQSVNKRSYVQDETSGVPLTVLYKPKTSKVVLVGNQNLCQVYYKECKSKFDRVVIHTTDESYPTKVQLNIFDHQLVDSDFLFVLDPLFNLNLITDQLRRYKLKLFLPFSYDLSDIWIEDLALTYTKFIENRKSNQEDEGYLSKDTSSINSNRSLMTTSNLIENRIYLVGAGPGSVDLLTLQAKRLIETSDVILSDKLIPPQILELAKPGTEIKFANKYLGNATTAQNELNEWGKEALLRNKTVIRLKGGDPFIFGRSGEELEFYKSIGYKVNIVPGLSSLLVGPSLNHLPLTLRYSNDQLLLLTGTTSNLSLTEIPVYSSKRNLCFAMFSNQLDTLLLKLIELGYPEQCKLAIISNVSLQDMKCQLFNLKDLSKNWKQVIIPKPAMLMVGRHLDCLL